MDPFQKQIQEKFIRDLENIQIGDSDSQLESSTEFYEGLKQKIYSQIAQMRNSSTKNVILEQLKANLNQEITNAQKFQEEINEMKFLNASEQSVIAKEKIEEIKIKIARQNQGKIILAEDQISTIEKQEQKKHFQAPQSKQMNSQKVNSDYNQSKKFLKNNGNIEQRIWQANLQRQRLNMQNQDSLSMKQEMLFISQFFNDRFLKFQIPTTQTIRFPLNIKITKPKSTFTNLHPLPNNQKNVLPKNNPEIALKTLKKNKRISLTPISQATIKIEFKKVEQPLSKFNQNVNQLPQNQVFLLKNQELMAGFKQLLKPYLKQIQLPLSKLQEKTKLYKPKFIKNYLVQNQKMSNIGIQLPKGAQRSIEQIILCNHEFQFSQEKNQSSLKQFKLTFENVTHLKGIQKFISLECIAIQYNLLKSINELQYSKKLIEVNLSNNYIQTAKPIEHLTELRYLNLNSNKLSSFSFQGGSLQILHLKKNQIQMVNDLNKNSFLRLIDLSQNKLHELGKGFAQLFFLQQLNLEKNYVSDLVGCENLIMLQKLNASHNRIKNIEIPLIFLFLNFLDLSYNQIERIESMFLPSLQKLYITNNKLKGEGIGKRVIYLPELKEFNIDDNQIEGFSIIWFLVRSSPKLEIIKYDSNQYFLSVRQKVRQLYQAIIYRNITNLKILNHSPYDSGIKAYYESVYSSYLQRGFKLQTLHQNFQQFQQLISFLVEENKIIALLETQNHKLRNQAFTEQNLFIEAKSVKRAEFLQKVIFMLAQITNSPPLMTKPAVSSSVLKIDQNIYYHHDRFQLKLLDNLHRIKSLFYKVKYKKQKKKKYFLNKKATLIKNLMDIEKLITTIRIKKVIKQFSQALKQNKEQKAAIIQKYWKGFKYSQLFDKIIKKLKQSLEDSFEMEEVDLGEFETHQFSQFNFDLPSDINFENYIIEPKYFQIQEDKNKKRTLKHQKLPLVQQHQQQYQKQYQEQYQEQYKPIMNNYLNEQKIEKMSKNSQNQLDQKIMKQWGFQNPATLEALRYKQKRKQEMKKKQALKNMTAAQRFQKFKMMHK